jgi:hypothetical protein
LRHLVGGRHAPYQALPRLGGAGAPTP